MRKAIIEMTIKNDTVKVDFPLEIRDDGFPPISVETLNGELLPNGFITLVNTPFFVEEIALGDIIEALPPSSNRNYLFGRVIEEGTSKSISIIFIVDSSKEEVYQTIKELGCYSEYGEFKEYNMLAVEVPKSVKFEMVINYLSKEEERGLISYSELCI
jgi:hypothetical protein